MCSMITFLNINNCSARIATSPVYINSPDSSVHAHAITSEVKCKAKMGHSYYWYNMNSILSSDGGFSGRLLHGSYTSYYKNHNLKCQGVFDRGLKQGIWTTWNLNGKVSERTHYSMGVADGSRELYDSSGQRTMRIYYRNGKRTGKTTIFSQDSSDSVIRYKNGVAIVPKIKNDSIEDANKRRKRKAVKTDTSATNSADSVKVSTRRKIKKSKSEPEENKQTMKRPMKIRIGEIFKRKDKKLEEQSDHE